MLQGFACSYRTPFLHPNQKAFITLNQAHKPTHYLATASVNNKGPIYIQIKCQAKVKDQSKSFKDLHWYAENELQNRDDFQIKSKIAHQLALPVYSDLQGKRWIKVKQAQIDNLRFKNLSWRVVKYDELPPEIDAQVSCSKLAQILGDDDIYLRSHLDRGKLEFWRRERPIDDQDHKSDLPTPKINKTHLERFNNLWSFKKSYPQQNIASIVQYKLPSLLGTRQGRQTLQLFPMTKGIKLTDQQSFIHINWRIPKYPLPKDLWFIVNLAPKGQKAFYLRVHIKKSSQKFVISQWPKMKHRQFLDPGSVIPIVDVVRGPWKCKHMVCMSEFKVNNASNK